jgi:hypothetical protein
MSEERNPTPTRENGPLPLSELRDEAKPVEVVVKAGQEDDVESGDVSVEDSAAAAARLFGYLSRRPVEVVVKAGQEGDVESGDVSVASSLGGYSTEDSAAAAARLFGYLSRRHDGTNILQRILQMEEQGAPIGSNIPDAQSSTGVHDDDGWEVYTVGSTADRDVWAMNLDTFAKSLLAADNAASAVPKGGSNELETVVVLGGNGDAGTVTALNVTSESTKGVAPLRAIATWDLGKTRCKTNSKGHAGGNKTRTDFPASAACPNKDREDSLYLQPNTTADTLIASVNTSMEDQTDTPSGTKPLVDLLQKQSKSPRRCARFWVRIVAFLAFIVLVVGVSVGTSRKDNGPLKVPLTTIQDEATISPEEDTTASPTAPPTAPLTLAPSKQAATSASSALASEHPSFLPTVSRFRVPLEARRSIFYVLGDAPYSSNQAIVLAQQIQDIPDDAEFVVHVGDIRANDRQACEEWEYRTAADVLKLSPVPVFMLLGDNDWVDCPNVDEALGYWETYFGDFDTKHWNHALAVSRPGFANFWFVHKYTLFIGVHISGNRMKEDAAWEERMITEADWTITVMRDYQQMLQSTFPGSNGASVSGRVVLFGHPYPVTRHGTFFGRINNFISYELPYVPIVYINGDYHRWMYETPFFTLPNFLRIMVTGRAKEPPTRLQVTATGQPTSVQAAFVYDRRLNSTDFTGVGTDDQYSDTVVDDAVYG